MKIIFFGNSEFSVLPLQKMIESFEVIAIVTAPDSVVGRGQQKSRLNPIKELALQHNIPILQPAKLKNNTEFHQALKEFNADLHIIVSYGKMIPKDLIELPKYNTINLHSSVLPKLRGAAPIQYALWQGLTQTGNTVQFISEGMDEGDIIDQSIVPIDPKDDYLALEQKLALNGAELLKQSVLKIQSNIANATPQNHDDATYTKLISKDDGAVHFSMSADDIYNAFRALKGRPGIFVPLSLGDIKIVDCELSPLEHSEVEGEILAITNDSLVISCYEGCICLKTVQAPNKKALCGKDFANGTRLKVGSVLK